MIQNPRKSHAALCQQLLDDPLLLDPPSIFTRVELEVFPPRRSRVSFWVIELRWPYNVAVEFVDGGRPRVRTEDIRIARQRRAAPWIMGLPGREYFLRRPLHVRRGLGRRWAFKPRVGFGPPATGRMVRTETLPDDTADIRVVDRAAEGRLEGG